mmetsp:Transcript_1618/g.5179  ORF Transcript_1618/g.5179 Transcript_1618/m.5179 type:complete len:204 (-) Transcript_1618:21-632(-)
MDGAGHALYAHYTKALLTEVRQIEGLAAQGHQRGQRLGTLGSRLAEPSRCTRKVLLQQRVHTLDVEHGAAAARDVPGQASPPRQPVGAAVWELLVVAPGGRRGQQREGQGPCSASRCEQADMALCPLPGVPAALSFRGPVHERPSHCLLCKPSPGCGLPNANRATRRSCCGGRGALAPGRRARRGHCCRGVCGQRPNSWAKGL